MLKLCSVRWVNCEYFEVLPCAATFADLCEAVIRGQFLHMHFDGVAVRSRRIFDFFDRDFVDLGELHYLA